VAKLSGAPGICAQAAKNGGLRFFLRINFNFGFYKSKEFFVLRNLLSSVTLYNYQKLKR